MNNELKKLLKEHLLHGDFLYSQSTKYGLLRGFSKSGNVWKYFNYDTRQEAEQAAIEYIRKYLS